MQASWFGGDLSKFFQWLMSKFVVDCAHDTCKNVMGFDSIITMSSQAMHKACIKFSLSSCVFTVLELNQMCLPLLKIKIRACEVSLCMYAL